MIPYGSWTAGFLGFVSTGHDGEVDGEGKRWDLPLQPPLTPILAKLARSIPDAKPGTLLFEPKWDGFRCLVFRDGDRIGLFSRNKRPLDRYFPELLDPLRRAIPERCVIDGEIVVPDRADRGLDFDALLQRIHPATSRIKRLAAETPAEFVAFDVLAIGASSLIEEPLLTRREALVEALSVVPSLRITPASTDRGMAERWFAQFEGAGLDGIIAKPVDGTYEFGKRALVKVKHERIGRCAVPGYRIHKDGKGVGSLLLGLWETSPSDGGRDLRAIGVAASFSVVRRSELLVELEPRRQDALKGHPWAAWVEWRDESITDESVGRLASPSGHSRWNAGKDLSFVPIRMGLVAEVRFGQLESGRFRHGVSFIRWCDDVDVSECTYDQLYIASPVRFADLFD